MYGADTEDGGWMARVSEPEMKDSLLNFEHASLKHSNLGGLGPDRGQEALIISQVGLVGGVSINMRFSVADGYAYDAKAESNGVSNGVASINLLNGAESVLNVELIDDDGNALALPRFFMSVLDVDAGSVPGDGSDPSKGAGIEEVEFSNISSYYIETGAQILVEETPAGGLRLTANLTGNEADNPSSPWGMSNDQLMKTAMVEFTGVSSFTMRLAISSQPGTSGRNFQLAGISDMITAPFGACAQATYLDLAQSTVTYNNLAGRMPGAKAMIFERAAELDGAGVDLVVTLKNRNYNPLVPSNNGKFGSLGQINLGIRDKARFNFSFVHSGTSRPVALPNLFVSFFDIDQTEGGYEKLTMFPGSGTYFLSESSTLKTKHTSCGKVAFSSTEFGDGGNNPRVLSNANEDQAVTFHFREPVSSFLVQYQTRANAARNFQFGGIAKAACA